MLGATGNLGSRIVEQALPRESVYGTSRHYSTFRIFKYQPDSFNATRFIELLNQLSPDVVINCIAMTSIDMCEQDSNQSLEINFQIPKNLSRLANDFGAKFVQISTDAVFDGQIQHEKYKEDDVRRPVNVYGQHKAMAEDSVLSSSSKNLIVRTNFFGFGVPPRKTFLDIALSGFLSGNEVLGFTDSVVTFLPVSIVAENTLALIEAEAEGVFHLAASESVSKFDFLEDFKNELAISGGLIVPVLSTSKLKAPRGVDLSLSSERIEAFLGKAMPLPYFRIKDFKYSGVMEQFDSLIAKNDN